jgi:protein SCO1
MTRPLLLALTLSTLAHADAPPAAPVEASAADVTVQENLGTTLPMALGFTAHDGQPVTLGTLFTGARPVLITPVYYACPTLCSLVLKDLVSTLRISGLRPGVDVDLLTYSIDPTETPAQAAAKRTELLRELGNPPDLAWPFLVGDAQSTRALSEALGFRYAYDKDLKQYAHSAVVMVLSPQGKLTRYIHGLNNPPGDLRLAVVEASQGRVGTSMDQVMLRCYQYDPVARRYGLRIDLALKALGTLTLLGLAALFLTLRRAEKRRLARQQASAA